MILHHSLVYNIYSSNCSNIAVMFNSSLQRSCKHIVVTCQDWVYLKAMHYKVSLSVSLSVCVRLFVEIVSSKSRQSNSFDDFRRQWRWNHCLKRSWPNKERKAILSETLPGESLSCDVLSFSNATIIFLRMKFIMKHGWQSVTFYISVNCHLQMVSFFQLFGQSAI